MKVAGDSPLLKGVRGLFALAFLSACAATPPVAPAVTAKQDKQELSVAVMPFEDHSIGMPPAKTVGLGQMLSDRISEGLLGQANIRLIDRDSLQKVLEELSLGSSEIANAESRLRLGKILGANYFIMGGFTVLGGTSLAGHVAPAGEGVRIDGRIIDVETGVVEGISVSGKFSGWTLLEASLSQKLIDLMIAKVAKEQYE
jgi:TolB-like protein